MRRIAPVLPEARFVHVIRDGRDVALSMMDVPWGPATVAEAAEMWVRDIRRARRQAKRLGHYMELRYEDLVGEPEACLRRSPTSSSCRGTTRCSTTTSVPSERIGEFARDFSMRRGVTMTANERAEQHRFTATPPRTDRSGRWRREMSEDDRTAFEGEGLELLEELGYA